MESLIEKVGSCLYKRDRKFRKQKKEDIFRKFYYRKGNLNSIDIVEPGFKKEA
jgi:hypothetical protein